MNRIVKIKKRLFDRVSAFLMVMLVILNATFMVPVHAAMGIPVVADATVAVASALSALGIQVSGNVSTPDWLSFINRIGKNISQKVFGGVTAEQTGNAVKYHLTHDFLKSVTESFGDYISTAEKGSDLIKSFPSGSVLAQNDIAGGINTEQFYQAIGRPYGSAGYNNYSSIGDGKKITSYCVIQKVMYSWTKSYFTDDIGVSILGKTYFFQNSSGGNSGGNYMYVKNASNQLVSFDCPLFYCPMNFGDGKQLLDGFLCSFQFDNDHSYVDYYLVNTAGSSGYLNYWPTNFKILRDDSTNPVMPMNDAQTAHFAPSVYAEGASALNQPEANVQDKLDAKAGEKDNTGAYTGVQVKVPADANTSNPSKLRDATSTQTKVVGDEVATEADKTADDTYNQTNNKDTTPPKSASMPSLELPTGLQKKFPFCLPWDLAAIYKLFNVTPKAPVWTIPVNIDQGFLHVHQTYTYDLNQNNVLDKGLPIFKWFLNISFSIGLIFITKRIMT